MLESSLSARRAWIEIDPACAYPAPVWSLSARRAWIEMCGSAWPPSAAMVALRKESVDRNAVSELVLENVLASLSARRAWIEILTTVLHWYHINRSLSARRAWIEIEAHSRCGRK